MKKTILTLLLLATVTITTLSGCVKIVKTDEIDLVTGNVEFDATENVQGLWEQTKTNIEEQSVDLPTFLTEANGDLKSLVDTYGKYSMGTSGTITYAVRGSGTITLVDQESAAGIMEVALDGYEGEERILLQIGSVYKGSSTRDMLDFISFGDYTNQQEWAEISKELHRLIDEHVIAPAEPSSLNGKTISFVGTFSESGNDELLITPVVLTVD